MVSAAYANFFSRIGNIDIPADSQFFGKPLDAEEMIAHAKHDRSRLMRALLTLNMAVIARLRQKLHYQRWVRHPTYGDRVGDD